MAHEEIHPIKEGYAPEGTRLLIVGTFPPMKEYTQKQEGFFFYSSEKNHFWNRIDNNFPASRALKKTKSKNKNETHEQNRKRKEKFSTEHGIGFIDIFTKIKRKRESARDDDIIPVETILQNRYFDKLIQNLDVKRICCTYDLAYEKIKHGIGLIGFTVMQVYEESAANREKLVVTRGGKSFEIVLLFPATRSNHKGTVKDKQYKKYLEL